MSSVSNKATCNTRVVPLGSSYSFFNKLSNPKNIFRLKTYWLVPWGTSIQVTDRVICYIAQQRHLDQVRKQSSGSNHHLQVMEHLSHKILPHHYLRHFRQKKIHFYTLNEPSKDSLRSKIETSFLKAFCTSSSSSWPKRWALELKSCTSEAAPSW